MALSDAEILKVKKHLERDPGETVINSRVSYVEESADRATELGTALTACDTALANIETAENAMDEIIAAEGANFDWPGYIGRLYDRYDRERKNLARILGINFKPRGGFRRR